MTNNTFLPVYKLIGKPIDDVGAHFEVLILRFGEYEIHASCFARILHNNKILLTTQDYQSWDGEDHKHNDMYLNIAKYGASLIGQKVRSVDVSSTNDLLIALNNDVRIEIFNSNGNLQLSEESEQWFFYKPKDKTYPFLSVSNKGAEQEQE